MKTIDERSEGFLAQFDMIRRMYENMMLEKYIIKKCGRALDQRGGQAMMLINHFLLARCIRLHNLKGELRFTNETSRGVEVWNRSEIELNIV